MTDTERLDWLIDGEYRVMYIPNTNEGGPVMYYVSDGLRAISADVNDPRMAIDDGMKREPAK